MEKIDPASPAQAVRLQCLKHAVDSVSEHQALNFEGVADKYWKWATQIQGSGGRPKDPPKKLK